MESEQIPGSNPRSAKMKLTGGQKWLIAALLVLQIPSSLLFYPLAALFALTGIGVPLSLILTGIGTMPYSTAMKCKTAWQSGSGSGAGVGPEPRLVTHV